MWNIFVVVKGVSILKNIRVTGEVVLLLLQGAPYIAGR